MRGMRTPTKGSSAAKRAARTRKLRAAGKKAARTRKRRAGGRKAAQTRKRRAGEEPLPPQLQCSKCSFGNNNPSHLADHLIQAHGCSVSAAWFEDGQENECLYPRLRADAGTFIVVGVDKAQSRGVIIASCTSLS
jgi:hypothetical protein